MFQYTKNQPIVKSFKKENMIYFSFMIPALLLFFTFFVYPSLGSIYYSLTNWHGLEKTINFVGLDNYMELFRDSRFYGAVWHTVQISVIVTVVQNGLALLLAVILNGKIYGRNFCRVGFFLPCILSPLAIGFIWSYILNPVDGVLNAFFHIVGLSFLANDWLGNANIALFTVMAIVIWQNTGYSMVIFMAGLNSVPDSYYEAAIVDGAGRWQLFRHITLPMVAPSVTINIMLSVIGCIKIFDVVYATTNGGPGNATETFTILLFSKAFGGNFEYGYGAAIAVVLFVFTMVVSQMLTRILRKREVEA